MPTLLRRKSPKKSRQINFTSRRSAFPRFAYEIDASRTWPILAGDDADMAQTSLMAWLKKPDVPSTIQLSSTPQFLPEQHSISANPVDFASATTTDLPDRTDAKAASLLNGMNKNLPSNVVLRNCTSDDIPRLRRLTSLLLPIQYPASFFREIVEDHITNSITLLAFWNEPSETTSTVEKGTLIGAVRCRLLAHPPGLKRDDNHDPMLYLSTLVLLSPYRHLGIATQLLDRVVRVAVRDFGIRSIGAHVWEANGEGLAWYQKRGFKQVSIEPNYYRRLKPSNAVVMQKSLSTLDLL